MSTTQPYAGSAATPPPEDEDYLVAHYQRIRKLDSKFLIHLLVALSVSVLFLFVFHWAADSPSETFWWWIYPFGFFTMSLTAHYYFSNTLYWKGVLSLIIIFNVILFLTWGLTQPVGEMKLEPPWFIYPALISAMGCVAFHFIQKKDWASAILHEYWLVCLTFFLSWLFYGRGFPWWVYPCFTLAIPVIIYHMIFVQGDRRLWSVLGMVLVIVNIMLFLTWEFTAVAFPWFIFPLAVSAGLIYWLYKRWKTTEGRFKPVHWGSGSRSQSVPIASADSGNLDHDPTPINVPQFYSGSPSQPAGSPTNRPAPNMANEDYEDIVV
jgi:hypothetical protein